MMKKLLNLVISFVALLTLGASLSAQSMPDFPLKFTAMFDETNIGESDLGTITYGSRVSVDESARNIDNYMFEFWVINGVVRRDLAPEHQFVVTDELDIIGVYSETGKHAVLFMDANGKLIDTQYVVDGQKSSEPDYNDSETNLPDKPGYVPLSGADRWGIDLEATNINESQVLILQYGIDTSQTFAITVNNANGTDTYNYNEIVTLTADSMSGNDYFSHWEINGNVVSYQQTYKFTVLEAMTIDAVYASEASTPEALINLYGDLELRGGYKSFRAQFEIPVGYELIDYGMLVSTGVGELELHSATKFTGYKWVAETGEFLMSFNDTKDFRNYRAYLVLEDTLTSDLLTFYSDSIHFYGEMAVKASFEDLTLNQVGDDETWLRTDDEFNDFSLSSLTGIEKGDKMRFAYEDEGYFTDDDFTGYIIINDLPYAEETQKTKETVMVEYDAFGAADGATLTIAGWSVYLNDYIDIITVPLNDTNGLTNITVEIDKSHLEEDVTMDALYIIIDMPNSGMTVDIYSITIYIDD